MQKLNFIFPLFLILIFSSCYYTKTLVVEPEYEQKVALFPGKAIRVIITDQRMETTNKSLKIPGMSMAGDFDKISPVLSARHQTLIETHIKNQFTKLGEAYVVHFYVTKGFQEFSAKAMSETEFVKFDIQLELKDAEDKLVDQCVSSKFLEKQSMDASLEFINAMYELAIVESINKCFAEMGTSESL